MPDISGEQKLMAIAAHISYLIGGLGFVAVPLILYLLKKDDPFVYDHARQALVAHLALLAAGGVAGILSFLLIGLLLWPVVIVLGFLLVITSIIAAFKALNGEYYRYPLIQSIAEKL